MSIYASKEGNGEPCPDCGATSTIRIEAVPAHARCLYCGNSWGPGGANIRPRGIIDVLKAEHEWFSQWLRPVLYLVFAMGFLIGFVIGSMVRGYL